MMCKFVGAQPPDPVLLSALEEKGIMIQGVPPEKFPGSAAVKHCVEQSCGAIWSKIRVCFSYMINRILNRSTIVYSETSIEVPTEIPVADESGQKIVGIDQGETKDLVEMNSLNMASSKSSKKSLDKGKGGKYKRPAHMEKYEFDFIRESIEHTDASLARIKADLYKKRDIEKQKKKEEIERRKYEKKHHPKPEDEDGESYKTLDDIDSHLQILSLEKGEQIKL